MKRLKQSLLIHVWDTYEFYLSTPKSFEGANKPFIFFYYLNLKTNKYERIRRYIGKNKGDIKKVQKEAKELVTSLVELLKNNWNPINDSYNEIKLSPNSNITDCISYWLKKREDSVKSNAIGKSALKNNRILMAHFSSYLAVIERSYSKVTTITNCTDPLLVGQDLRNSCVIIG